MKIQEFFHSGPSAGTAAQWLGKAAQQGTALLLSALMVLVPMGQQAFAEPSAAATSTEALPYDGGAPANESAALGPEQLQQLVAPVALYPDSLVAQVLAASTYPTQVVEADRWRTAQGNAPAEQVAAQADTMNWDPSVKALCAFPTVLAQMDKNIQWTTDLGNAYYNQPQDVMDAVQAMRAKAQAAGNLRNTPQETVSEANGAIAIEPANPEVVYVPVYDPWAVWGYPVVMYPGYYWAAPPGIFWGGLAIGFGIGIGIGWWGHWGWGWGHWGCGWGPRWGGHGVIYNHNTYISRSSTVINRGAGRPGGPSHEWAGTRGSYARAGARPMGANGFHNNMAGHTGAASSFGRTGNSAARTGSSVNRGGSSYGRSGGSTGSSYGRTTNTYGRSGSTAGSTASRGPSVSYGHSSGSYGGARSSGGASAGHVSGGGGHASSSGGGHMSGGGGGHAGGGGGHR